MLTKMVAGIAIASVLLNIVLGVYVFHPSQELQTQHATEPPAPNLPFLSPRIFAQRQNDILINFVELRKQLKAYTPDTHDTLGYYFEYLPSGNSIGINEKDPFVLASLLKVPLVMGVYRLIEEGKIRHTQVLTITQQDIDKDFGDLWKRGVGATLTVDEAIRLTLVQSDNTAKNVLQHLVPTGAIEDVFDGLDIPKELEHEQAVVTPKNYTSVLRSLYLSSYVSKESSNQILEIMTQSSFTDKIVAGIGSDVVVAHKIGVNEPNNPSLSVYTDCGIIYVPKRPYTLCIMSRSPEDHARKYMKDISSMVYQYVTHANT